MGDTQRAGDIYRRRAPRGQVERSHSNRSEGPEYRSANSQRYQPEAAIGHVRCLAVSLVRQDTDAMSRRQLLDRLVYARTCEQSINNGRSREQHFHDTSPVICVIHAVPTSSKPTGQAKLLEPRLMAAIVARPIRSLQKLRRRMSEGRLRRARIHLNPRFRSLV